MEKIHAEAPVNDYSPNLYVTHCLKSPDGNYFLLMWHCKDHHVYAFNSEQGVCRMGGMENMEFMTYEDACRDIDSRIREIPNPQG